RVEAWANGPAPGTHVGRSEEIALRLPSFEELRAATRAAAQDIAAAADSLAQAERELGGRTRDLAQQRSRDAAGQRSPAEGRDGPLPFQATERAQAVAREQEALQQRVQELSRAVEEITRAAQAAGLGDTAFQARLREVQELLQRAVTPELAARLRELQEAVARLDRADSLARGIERVATDLRAAPRTPLAAPLQATRDARAAMQRAAQAADDARAAAASDAGSDAERQLAGVPEALRGQRDSLAREW